MSEKIAWICHSKDTDGDFTGRTVWASSYEEAASIYREDGMYTFVHAEPQQPFNEWRGSFPPNASYSGVVKKRLTHLGVIDADGNIIERRSGAAKEVVLGKPQLCTLGADSKDLAMVERDKKAFMNKMNNIINDASRDPVKPTVKVKSHPLTRCLDMPNAAGQLAWKNPLYN